MDMRKLLLLVRFGYMLRYLGAILLFSHKMPKKANFPLRLGAGILFCFGTVFLVPLLTEDVSYVSFLLLMEAFAAIGTVKASFDIPWSEVFYIAAAAFSAEHLASMLDSLFSLLSPEVLSLIISQQFHWPILLYWFFFAAIVYILVYLLIFQDKRMAEDLSLNFANTLLFLIVSICVNLFLNMYYTSLVKEIRTTWIAIFEYSFNILCSSFLLSLQVMMLREIRMKKQLDIVSMLWAHAREQYWMSRENVEAINIKCHDLKHLLLKVKDKTNEQEYAHMLALLDSYGAEIETNNEVLNVVFQEKNFQCRKLGIQFTCIIDGAALNFMETTDLYVLFGNLIDNCIEAVSQLSETEVKNIQVTVRQEKGFVIITTENGYAGELHWVNGRPKTSKKDQENHGYGILSIEQITKKYGGSYSIQNEEHIFTMNLVFPISQPV